MSFPPSFFDRYEDWLNLAVHDINQELRESHMGLKLQGLAAKVAKLHHDAEFEAAKLDAKVEGLSANLPNVFSGAHGAVDGLASTVNDVEAAFKEIQSVSNGGPALESAPLASGAPSNTP